tara:strand:+ start:1000 stop:1575 length:576 start_codon:yes stop_codon:yes gene_type:complete
MKIQFGKKLDESLDYFVTSDLHFLHKNILTFSPEYRPWGDKEAMTEGLIEKWNDTVPEEGVVFHLGDFSFGNIQKTKGIISRLNGTIVWLLGNHDRVIREQHRSVNKFDLLELRYEGHKVCMMHYAPRVWNQSHRGSIALWGHSHGSLPPLGRSMDVGWDAQGKILRLEEAINMCLAKDIHTVDHHTEEGT